VAFDIDGVVADTMTLFLDIARQEYQLNSVQYSDITSYKLEECLDIDPEIIDAMTKTQSQSTSNPTSIALKAALEALKGPQESVEAMKKEFAKRRDYMVERSNSIKGMSCQKPPGAFYVFPNITGLLGKSFGSRQINNSTELTDYLLDAAKVAVVPGIEFGMEGYLRLSYATSLDNIKKGMDRIEEAVAELK